MPTDREIEAAAQVIVDSLTIGGKPSDDFKSFAAKILIAAERQRELVEKDAIQSVSDDR